MKSKISEDNEKFKKHLDEYAKIVAKRDYPSIIVNVETITVADNMNFNIVLTRMDGSEKLYTKWYGDVGFEEQIKMYSCSENQDL